MKKIKEPVYVKEEMSRPVKWFFGLPLVFVIYLMLSLIMPNAVSGYRASIALNIISYIMLLLVFAMVVTRFLKFPFRKLLNENSAFSFRNFFAGFVPMFLLGLGTTFLRMALQPENFTFSLSSGWVSDFALSLILVVLAALMEELSCRSYVGYFLKDNLETRTRHKIPYCLASAVLFTVLHFSNPEIRGAQAFYAMAFYFVMGFALMAVTFRTRGIESALGIHIANNLVSAWFFTYENAALTTNAIFTQSNNIGPLTLIQSVVCLVLSTLFVIAVSE